MIKRNKSVYCNNLIAVHDGLTLETYYTCIKGSNYMKVVRSTHVGNLLALEYNSSLGVPPNYLKYQWFKMC